MSEIEQIVFDWKEELGDLKRALYEKGGEANNNEYSLRATEALRLSMCLNDLQLAIELDKPREQAPTRRKDHEQSI